MSLISFAMETKTAPLAMATKPAETMKPKPSFASVSLTPISDVTILSPLYHHTLTDHLIRLLRLRMFHQALKLIRMRRPIPNPLLHNHPLRKALRMA